MEPDANAFRLMDATHRARQAAGADDHSRAPRLLPE
jgi:hypothetical protein